MNGQIITKPSTNVSLFHPRAVIVGLMNKSPEPFPLEQTETAELLRKTENRLHNGMMTPGRQKDQTADDNAAFPPHFHSVY